MKEFLKEAGVSFQDIDVSSDETARGEMVRKAGQMVVPIIEVNGDIIVGFKEGELREKLDL